MLLKINYKKKKRGKEGTEEEDFIWPN